MSHGFKKCTLHALDASVFFHAVVCRSEERPAIEIQLPYQAGNQRGSWLGVLLEARERVAFCANVQ